MQAIFAVLSNGSMPAPTPVPSPEIAQNGAQDWPDFTDVMSNKDAAALARDAVLVPADLSVTEGGALPLPVFWLPLIHPLSVPASVEATGPLAADTGPPAVPPVAALPPVAADGAVASPAEMFGAAGSAAAIENGNGSVPGVVLPEGGGAQMEKPAPTDRPVAMAAPLPAGQIALPRPAADLAKVASAPLIPSVLEPIADASVPADPDQGAAAPMAQADGHVSVPAPAASWPAVQRADPLPSQARAVTVQPAPSSAQVAAVSPPEGSPTPVDALPDGLPRDDRQPDPAPIPAAITGRTTPDALPEPLSPMHHPATPAAPKVSAEALLTVTETGEDVPLDAASLPELPPASMRAEKGGEVAPLAPQLVFALAPAAANAMVRPLLPAWLELAELDQRAELEFGAIAAAPAGPAAPASAGPTAMVPAQQPLAAQVLQGLARHQDGTTEITLSPEELGTVRLRLRPDPRDAERMVVMLSFDRPETMDLFRRNADQLAEAIRSAGYAGVDIGFDQGSRSDGSGFAGTSDNHPDVRGEVSSALAPVLQPPPPRAHAGAGLDLRL